MTNIGNIASQLTHKARELVFRFRKNCEGVAALEFALIAPIMIIMFVGTLEVSSGVSVNRKVSRISSVVADLITQAEELSGSEISKIMDVSKDIMEPYNNAVKIRITGISVTGGKGRVVWSCNRGWSSLPVNSIYTLPAKIKSNGAYLVAAQVQTEYHPMVGWARYSKSAGVSFDAASVTMDEEIFLRPRVVESIDISKSLVGGADCRT